MLQAKYLVLFVAWSEISANTVPLTFYNAEAYATPVPYEMLTTICQNASHLSQKLDVTSLETCKQLCDANPNCTAIDTNGVTGCYLKGQCEGQVEQVTGNVKCSDPFGGYCGYRKAFPKICFLYGNSVADITSGVALKAGPLKFDETVRKQFANATSRVYIDIIAASGASCPNSGPSLVGAIGFTNLSNKDINIFGYGPGSQSSATLQAPRVIANGALTHPRDDQMALITLNNAKGFTSCSVTILEGSTLIADVGPYTIGSGSSSSSRLPVAEFVFTWTCDAIVVGTLTRPKHFFCGETVFLSTVVGNKGGTGDIAPHVRMIQGKTCPTPTTSTTTVTTTTTATKVSLTSSFLSGGTVRRGPYLGVAGGAVRVFANVFVILVLLFATGHTL